MNMYMRLMLSYIIEITFSFTGEEIGKAINSTKTPGENE